MNNSEILGEEAAVRQLVSGDFSATNGHFEDDSVKTLRTYPFYGKTSIKSVSFPTATEIRDGFFKNCTNLTEINLRALTTIAGGNIFAGVKAPLIFPELTTYPGLNAINAYGGTLIDLGTKIGNINSYMFQSDSNLVTLILRKATIASLSNVNAFNNTKYAANGAGGAYVYVPRNLISSYQTATNWSTLYAAHSDMFRPLEDYTVDGTTTGEFDEALITTPTHPMYAVTDYAYDTNHTITTTAEGHVTVKALSGASASYNAIAVNGSGVPSSGNWFNLQSGETLKVTIRNLTTSSWGSISMRITNYNTGGGVIDISANALKAVFNDDDDSTNVLTFSYTNTGSGNIQVSSLRITNALAAGGTLDFGISASIDNQRIF